MAFPFGSTTLGAYLAWAASEGCQCRNGYELSGMVLWRIVAPSGRSLVIVDMQQSERLTSHMLNHYDRRLGLTSPFPRIEGA